MNFSGKACNLWLKCNNGMGVATKPALNMGRIGSRMLNHNGSLGNNPISSEATFRFMPPPGISSNSEVAGNGLKCGDGARVNI